MATQLEQSLKHIRFEGELLPTCAQLLDAACRICRTSKTVREWFARFTRSNGVEDSDTVISFCDQLRAELNERKEEILQSLKGKDKVPKTEPTNLLNGWIYSLDTMIQQASDRETCSWMIDGKSTSDGEDCSDGGEVTLRRV